MEKFGVFSSLLSIYATTIRLYVNKFVLFLLGNMVYISLGLQSYQIKKVTEDGSSHSGRSQGKTLIFLAYSTPEQTKHQVWLLMPNDCVA